MIVKLTPWETRNLGVPSSAEFMIEPKDSWDDVAQEIAAHSEVYQVMHIPCGNTDVLLHAQDAGFRMIETNLRISRKLKGAVEMPRLYQRFEPFLSCTIATEAETQMVLDVIRSGEMFTTDKVARDPAFGQAAAGNRYACWTKDVLEQGADLLIIRYKDEPVAFDICAKPDPATANAFLGGVLPAHKDKGLGFAPIFMITKYAAQNGYRKIVTGVSSNNLPILKLHALFDYQVEEMSYCLTKHL